MSSRRSSLLTVNSLTRLLSKGSSHDIVDSIKICNTWKTLSTCAERLEFQSVSAYDGDDSLNYQQSHTKFYPASRNGTNSYRLPCGQSLDNVNQARASGYYGRSSVHNQNSSHQYRGYFEGLQNEIGNKQSEHGGNFSVTCGHKNDNPERISSGIDETYGGPNLNNDVNVFQNNLVRHRGIPDGNSGQNNTEMQQNLNRVNVSNSKGLGKHLNGFVEDQDGFYPQQNLNGVSGDLGSSYASWTEGQTDRAYHSNTFCSQVLSEPPGSLKGNLNQNFSSFQQAPNNLFRWSNNMSNQCNPGSGQFPQNVKDSQYPRNLQTVQSSTIGSQLSDNAKAEMESAEASGSSSPYRVSLEELDNSCMEGKVKEAVEILGLLEKQRTQVDLARYLQLMHQCGEAKALEEAKVIHEHVVRHLSPLKVSTYNRILEMYSKCGSMDDAFKVFNNMSRRNLTTWDTMITWLAKNGLAEDSIDLFTQFKKMGLKPDGKMFIGVFAACNMLGDIDEGILHFESMTKSYGIVPSMAHHVSVVDMLGSVGHLDEAFQFVENMPVEPSADVWETLMIHCRIHGNMELGDRCAELVEQSDPSRLNEQSEAGLVPARTSDLAKEKEKKLANQNLLEVRSRVHEYRAGDTSHPENDKIYALLRSLRSQMKELGYIPETRFVLHDIDQEGKEEALLAHSERLAVGYGLLTSSARSPIRVIKNLRFCGDCHNALKIISKIVGRDLIIRDAKRFHHFSDGVCSCGDYW